MDPITSTSRPGGQRDSDSGMPPLFPSLDPRDLFHSLFPPSRKRPEEREELHPSVIIPHYERLSEHAHPLEAHAPSVYLLRAPRVVLLQELSTVSVPIDIRIRVPEDVEGRIFQPQGTDQRFQVHAFSLTSMDQAPLRLLVTNTYRRIRSIYPGDILAAISFSKLLFNMPVREVHPEEGPPMYSFSERILADKRALFAARCEVELLGFGQEKPRCWPPRKVRSASEDESMGYVSDEDELASTTSPLVPLVKEKNLPWNYSWGKDYSLF